MYGQSVENSLVEQTLESETKEIILGKVESRQCLKTFFPGGVIKQLDDIRVGEK